MVVPTLHTHNCIPTTTFLQNIPIYQFHNHIPTTTFPHIGIPKVFANINLGGTLANGRTLIRSTLRPPIYLWMSIHLVTHLTCMQSSQSSRIPTRGKNSMEKCSYIQYAYSSWMKHISLLYPWVIYHLFLFINHWIYFVQNFF